MLMLSAGHQQENVVGKWLTFTRIKPMTKDYVSSGSNMHDKAPRCYSGCGAGNHRTYVRDYREKTKSKKI